MKKTVLIAVPLLAIIFIIIYSVAGGFKEAHVVKKTTTVKYIIGKYYEGEVKNDSFPQLFTTIEELKKRHDYKGNLGAVYYNNPAHAKGVIKAFLGIIVIDDIENIPVGFEKKKLESIHVLEGKIEASNLFGISINNVYSSVFSFAEANNISLEEHYVEWFPSKDELIVQVKIKKE